MRIFPLRDEIVGEYRPGKGLTEDTGRLGDGVLMKTGGQVELLVQTESLALLAPQGPVGLERSGEWWRGLVMI